MRSFAAWLKATSLSRFVTDGPWFWPLCETLHFMGMALLIGVTGLLDLRLLGFMKGIPVASLMALMPWAILGFVINLVTGALFFIGAPDQYVNNLAFYAKLFFIMLAGVNVIFFQVVLARKTSTVGAGQDASPLAKIVAATSLICWLAVMYWGRMLPFLGSAF